MSALEPLGTLVVVGGGLAGAKTVEAAREQGFEGKLILICSEHELPYERPPLSKEYLRGESDFSAQIVHDDAWYAAHFVDVRRGETVSALHLDAQRIDLSGGEGLAYDALVLAMGSAPVAPQVPGAHDQPSPLRGVFTLRTHSDADALRAALTDGARVVVVGGGWIGLEAAASARTLGAKVSVVIRGEQPLQRVLGPRLGAFYAGVHRSHGTDVLTGRTVSRVLSRDGAVTGVELDDGRTLEADVVVFGLGADPLVGLAIDAGLDVANGVVVDAGLRSSDPHVWAVGDVANHDHPRWGRLRVEHWDNALHQPQAAMRSIMGCGGAYARQPYFYSDQYDTGMEYVGHVEDPEGTDVIIRGSLERGEFVALWVGSDDRLLASMNVNVWDVVDQVTPLIDPTLRVDRVRLADPDVAFRDAVATD